MEDKMSENWDELIKQQERSGLKPAAFCRAHGIDSQKFGYQRWRRKGAQKKEHFVRVDSGAVTHVEIVVRDGVTIRTPLSAVKEVLEALDATRS
jgi:hypothetical protein